MLEGGGAEKLSAQSRREWPRAMNLESYCTYSTQSSTYLAYHFSWASLTFPKKQEKKSDIQSLKCCSAAAIICKLFENFLPFKNSSSLSSRKQMEQDLVSSEKAGWFMHSDPKFFKKSNILWAFEQVKETEKFCLSFLFQLMLNWHSKLGQCSAFTVWPLGR